LLTAVWTTPANIPLVTHLTPAGVSLAIQVLQGLLTPVIAGTTTYIAYQQWKTNERRAVLDRYERRLRIYQRVVEMLRLVCANFNPEIHDLLKFAADTAEADFIFGREIPEYLDEVYKHGVNLNTAKFEYRDFTHPVREGYDHQKVVNAMAEEKKWFLGQFSVAKEKFQRYLDISR
jgi:hypothetical protein